MFFFYFEMILLLILQAINFLIHKCYPRSQAHNPDPCMKKLAWAKISAPVNLL